MMEPEPYELPDGIRLTTLGEARRCGWEFRWAYPWGHDEDPWRHTSSADEVPPDVVVFARNPNPPKPLEAGQVRDHDGQRVYVVGPSLLEPGKWWAEFDHGTGHRYEASELLSLPVVEQEPREQKPRRMKANPRSYSVHDEEHDESEFCRLGPVCTPVEQEGEG